MLNHVSDLKEMGCHMSLLAPVTENQRLLLLNQRLTIQHLEKDQTMQAMAEEMKEKVAKVEVIAKAKHKEGTHQFVTRREYHSPES